jgi:hypothetical protein
MRKLLFAGILAALALAPLVAFAAVDEPSDACPCGWC